MKLTYNSERPDLIIPEYGRHIQNMVDHLMTIEDREERNKEAQAIINVMGQLFPHLRDVEDFRHKLWDHLYIMSKFQLDLDSPYPKPSPETLDEKPKQLKYPQRNIRYGHYGVIVQDMIADAKKREPGEERDAYSLAIGNLMKRLYLQWNRDTVKDEQIANDLKELSGGTLTIVPDTLADAAKLLPPSMRNDNSNMPKRGKRKGKSKKRRN